MMVILGVDPGFQFSGFGVIKKEERKIYLVDYGILKLNSSKSLSDRIEQFYNHFGYKIKDLNATDISIETPFLYKNAQNFLKLGYLRGILYLLAKQNNLKIHEFTPRQIKQSITGFGGAGKDQVANVLLKLFPLMKVHDKYDVTDAIAAGLCGAWSNTHLV